jgi:hypothetical protein
MRKPWFRKGRGYFVTTDGGKQVKLGDTEQEAYAEWEKLKSASIDGPDPYVAAIINAFVTSIENTRSKATHAWYSPYLLAFLSEHDTKTVGQLKRHHLTRWAESKFPTKGARTAAIRSVKSCFNWAVDEEVIKSSPFARVQTPASGRRETLVTVETQNQILADLGNWRNRRPFRLVLIAMRLSGCRPGEIRGSPAPVPCHFIPYFGLGPTLWTAFPECRQTAVAEERGGRSHAPLAREVQSPPGNRGLQLPARVYHGRNRQRRGRGDDGNADGNVSRDDR